MSELFRSTSRILGDHLIIQLLDQLFKVNIIKEGNFILKSGASSSIYINLKELVSYPQILALVVVLLKQECDLLLTSNVVLCGIPYGGIPIATALSLLCNCPQILIRKKPKQYGMKKQIEGIHKKNIVLIEDVVTTGSSVMETCALLESNGYSITGIISIIYRGEKPIINKIGNYPYKSLLTINDIKQYKLTKLSISKNSLQNTLLNHKKRKQSNIILAFDKNYLGSILDLYNILNKIHSHIIGLKVHNEILKITYDENIKLYKKCKELDIFLWEDRKFNDIGNTIQEQIKYYTSIRDFISIVPIGGALSIPQNTSLGIFLLAELSCKNNIINVLNTQDILTLAKKKNVCGIICQHPENVPFNIPTIMPGIHLNKSSDGLNQQWRDPSKLKYKADFYVVGRAITDSENPEIEVLKYKQRLLVS